MKKITILLVVIFVSNLSFAQIENIKLNNDSSIIVNELYAGVLSGSMFSLDSLHANQFVDLRVGMRAEWKINNNLSLQGTAMLSTDLDANNSGLHQIHLDWKPSEKHLFQVGNMPTLSTEQRPDPLSGNGQFESFTEAQIVGQALGAKYTFNLNKDVLFGAGIAYRGKHAEYHIKTGFKAFTMSAYYAVHDESSGLAFTYDGDRIFNTFVFKTNDVISNVFVYKLAPSIKLDVFADVGYDLDENLSDTDRLVRCEIGALKTFESDYINGFFGISYQYETNSVNGLLFVHL